MDAIGDLGNAKLDAQLIAGAVTALEASLTGKIIPAIRAELSDMLTKEAIPALSAMLDGLNVSINISITRKP